ncbi:hypothetical protein Tco_1286073 [Tanacetum coccineum]
MGTIWCLYDPTPSGWCKTDAHSTDFGSISTWEDLTTRFLAQFFPPGRTTKHRNGILMFQQHQFQIFYDHVNPATRRTIDHSASGKLRDRNDKESWALLEDLALYDNESWNDPRDFARPVKAISFPQDASRLVSNFMTSQDARLSKFDADFKQQQGEMTNKIDKFLKAINDRIIGALPSDTVKNLKLNDNSTSPFLSARSYPLKDPQCLSHIYNLIIAIKTCSKQPNKNDQSKIKTLTVNEIGTPKLKEPERPLDDEFRDLHLNLSALKVLAHAPMYNAILDRYVESLELGKNGSTFNQGEMPKKIKDSGLFTLLYWILEETRPCLWVRTTGPKVLLVGIVKNVEVHIGKLKLLEDFYIIDMKNDLATPLLVRRGFLATVSIVRDCRKAKIAVGEGVTRSIFGEKEIDPCNEEIPSWTTLGKQESYTPRPSTDGIGARTPYYAKKDFTDYHFPGEWELTRDAELNPFKDILVFRKMVEFLGTIPINLKGNMWELEDLIENLINWDRPPKEGDGVWHIRIELIDPDGLSTRTISMIPTFRKLSAKENPGEIIDLDHFHDS